MTWAKSRATHILHFSFGSFTKTMNGLRFSLEDSLTGPGRACRLMWTMLDGMVRICRWAGWYVAFALVTVAILVGGEAVSLSAQTQPVSQQEPDNEQQSPVTVEPRVQLFVTLCALDAAGFDSNGAPGDTPGRIQLRQRMLQLKGPAVDALRKYYQAHALGDPGSTLSRFISFALAVGPPPKFAFQIPRDELPPEALALQDFNPILAKFYQEAQIGKLWQRYHSDYQKGVEFLRPTVSKIVFRTTIYLREMPKPGDQRTFAVYVEPLVGALTTFRNYGNHYYLVINPSPNVPVDDIRHAFLHFLLDPLALRYQDQAQRLSPLLNIGARAPQLPAEYADDFSGYFTECLVRAVELRLRGLSPAALNAALDQDDATGYVIVRPIYEGLVGFEKSAPSMSAYLPDLIKGIDVAATERRLTSVHFAAAGASTGTSLEAREQAARASKPVDPVEQELRQGRQEIAERNSDAAAQSFRRVLAAHPEDMRATYGLAIASALLGDPDTARQLFSKVIAASQDPAAEGEARPDPANVAWSHVYLGRMYDVEGNRKAAVTEYRAALGVKGAPASSLDAAQRGVKAAYHPPSQKPRPDGKM